MGEMLSFSFFLKRCRLRPKSAPLAAAGGGTQRWGELEGGQKKTENKDLMNAIVYIF